MSDTAFGKFIPGFEFLQSLGKVNPGSGTLPPFSHWVAPTLSIEEINKRIDELKAVQFWLEQNSKALAATVQALEVQKMTLSTLQGMNVNLADMAKAFPFAAAAMGAGSSAEPGLSGWPLSPAQQSAGQPADGPSAASESAAQEQTGAWGAQEGGGAQAGGMAAAAMQWWGALTQQFQQIAQQVMQDPAQQQAVLQATQMSTDFARTAVRTAGDMVRQAVAQTQAAAGTASPARAGSGSKSAATDKPAPASKPSTSRRAAAPKATPAAAKTSKAAKTAAAAKRSSPATKTKTSARK